MKTSFKTFAFFLLVLPASQQAPAADKIKIIKVKDANLFITQNGTALSLSNVQTFSISDTDSCKRNFALKVYKSAERLLQGRTFQAEIEMQQDSSSRVHIWKILPFSIKSINEIFLKNGWGLYIEAPRSDHSAKYRSAAKEASKGHYGIHDEPRFARQKPAPYAIWLSAGVGVGSYSRGSHWSESINGDLALHFRRKGVVLSAGAQAIGYSESTSSNSVLLLFGKSFFGKYQEMVFSLGASLNKWHYTSDIGSHYSSTSNIYAGFQGKVQVFVHFRQALGLGFSFDAGITKKANYYALTLNLLLGYWH